MGVMSGTLDLIQRAYLGTEIRDDVLRFDPRATDRIDGLSLLMQFRRTALRVALDHGELTIATLAEGARGTIRVGYRDDVRELSGGQRCAFTVST